MILNMFFVNVAFISVLYTSISFAHLCIAILDVIPNACMQEGLNLYYCSSQEELFSIERCTSTISI